MFREIKRNRTPEYFLIDIIKGMERVAYNIHFPRSIFYLYKGEIVFELSKDDLYVNEELIWDKLYQIFNSNTHIRKLILSTFNEYSSSVCEKIHKGNTYRYQMVKNIIKK